MEVEQNTLSKNVLLSSFLYHTRLRTLSECVEYTFVRMRICVYSRRRSCDRSLTEPLPPFSFLVFQEWLKVSIIFRESSFYTNTAPTGDDKLHPDDAVNILEELLDAQNESRTFGLKLNLPVDEVEAIFTKYSDPRDRLLHIILAFLRQAEPRPTWRVIVDALRSPIVNLTALARRVEAAHFPDLAAARDVAPGKSLHYH